VAQDGQENRKTPRRSVLGHAVIYTPSTRANCVVRDISQTGAKLGVSRNVKLPPVFDLFLVKTNSKRRVLLKWRAGDFAGIEFCTSAASMPQREQTPGGKEQDVWVV